MGEDPGGAGAGVVVRAADQGRVYVGGEGDSGADLPVFGLLAGAEFRPLLRPGAPVAAEDPRGAETRSVAVCADEHRCAVGRDGDRAAEAAVAALVLCRQLRARLRPAPAGAEEGPDGAAAAVVRGAADDRGVAVGGERDGAAEAGVAALVGRRQPPARMPARAGATEDPGAVAAAGTDECGVAVCRQRHAAAEGADAAAAA